MTIPRVGVGVMIVQDGCVLLGRRVRGQRPGWWGWIGGRLEFGEAHAAAPDELTEWAWYPLADLPGPIFEPAELALKSYRTGILVNEWQAANS